jgi:hypothetical protein
LIICLHIILDKIVNEKALMRNSNCTDVIQRVNGWCELTAEGNELTLEPALGMLYTTVRFIRDTDQE